MTETTASSLQEQLRALVETWRDRSSWVAEWAYPPTAKAIAICADELSALLSAGGEAPQARRCEKHGPLVGVTYCPECASSGHPWTDAEAEAALPSPPQAQGEKPE